MRISTNGAYVVFGEEAGWKNDCQAEIVSGDESVEAQNESPVCVFFTRESLLKGNRLGSENSFKAQGVSWNWAFIAGSRSMRVFLLSIFMYYRILGGKVRMGWILIIELDKLSRGLGFVPEAGVAKPPRSTDHRCGCSLFTFLFLFYR